jgi:SAM-dependent methyltransferase
LSDLEPWRDLIAPCLPTDQFPVLDVGAGTGIWMRALAMWFDGPVVGVEPSEGMRTVGTEVGLPPRARYVAAYGEKLPFGPSRLGAAWLSTVVHHLGDLPLCVRELRRVLIDGAPVMIRNSFSGRLDDIELFRHFPAAAAVATRWPSLEEVASHFTEARFDLTTVHPVREGRWQDLSDVREWAMAMRKVDSALVPLSDAEFSEGLANIDQAIDNGETPRATLTDFVVFTKRS